jgi:Tol biopolymer transport system component
VVFISHEKSDDGLAHEIRDHLEAGGFACWMAPDDIRGPTPWPEQIARAIDSCDVMLVVVSAHANGSPHVSREVDLAVEKGKPLLPVRVEDIVPTGSLDYLLRLAQWIDLFPGTVADHATNLQTTVASMLPQRDPTPPPPPTAPPSTPPATHRRRPPITRRALAVVAAVAVLAVIGIAIALTRDDSGTDIATDETADQALPDEPAAEEPNATNEPTTSPTATEPPPSGEGTGTRVSIATDGTEGNGHSVNPAISGDGRYVAFDSLASNLVDGDSGQWRDVFWHDRETAETIRVEIGSNCDDEVICEEPNGASRDPRISADGRYVVFVSDAVNLDGETDDTNGVSDIYLHNRETGDTRLVSLAPDGTQHGLHSIDPSMSDDGTLIAYATYVDNERPPKLAPGIGTYTAWVHNAATQTTTRLAEFDTAVDCLVLSPPVVSHDGTVAVTGASAPCGREGEGGEGFVFERDTGQVVDLVTASLHVENLIPIDAGEVLFRSSNSRLVPDDLNGHDDIFAIDRTTGDYRLVLESLWDGNTFISSVSSDGRFATVLQGDRDEGVEILDLAERVPADAQATLTPVPGGARGASWFELSGDARWGTLSVINDTLVAGDTNGKQDVFVIQLRD